MKKMLYVFWILLAASLVPADGFSQARIKQYPSRISVIRTFSYAHPRTLPGRPPVYYRAYRAPVFMPSVREPLQRNEPRINEQIFEERESRQAIEANDAAFDLRALERDLAALKEEVGKLGERVVALAMESREARKPGADIAKIELLKKELRELRALLSELKER